MKLFLVVASLLLPMSSLAAAESPTTTGEAEPAVRVCDAFGPGYTQVPGTNTCIKVSGSVEFDASVTGGQSGQPK